MSSPKVQAAIGNVTFAYEMLEALKSASERRKSFYGVDYKLTPEENELQALLIRLHHDYTKVYKAVKDT